MAIRTEYAGIVDVLMEQKVGRYVVQVYEMKNPYLSPPTSAYVYRILLNGQNIRCWTDADERTFPKKAAMVGHNMVEQLKAAASAKA